MSLWTRRDAPQHPRDRWLQPLAAKIPVRIQQIVKPSFLVYNRARAVIEIDVEAHALRADVAVTPSVGAVGVAVQEEQADVRDAR